MGERGGGLGVGVKREQTVCVKGELVKGETVLAQEEIGLVEAELA